MVEDWLSVGRQRENWNVEMMEGWKIGMLECWKAGKLEW
jgi:hypothetical protein